MAPGLPVAISIATAASLVESVMWSEIGEVVKSIAAVIAWRELEKWRSETLGKRRAEIAESALASVFEMEEILRDARTPWVGARERVKIEGVADDIALDVNFTPEARLLQHQEFFARFRAQKYAFAAVFGRDAAEPLDGLWRVRLEINWAVGDLIRNKDAMREDRAGLFFMKRQRDIAFRPSSAEDDDLGKRIAEHVEAVEKTCRPAIEARSKI